MRHFECVECPDTAVTLAPCRICGGPVPKVIKRGIKDSFCSEECRRINRCRSRQRRYAKAKERNQGLTQSGPVREFTCVACGVVFQAPVVDRRCCSPKCESDVQSAAAIAASEARAALNPKPILTCAHCQKPFHPSRASAAQKAAGYIQQCCSVKCRIDRERALRPVVSKPVPHSTCKVCSVSFPGPPNKRYCSDKCREVGTRMAKSTYSCVSCGSEFAYVKTGGKPKSTCGPECAKILQAVHKERSKPAKKAARARREARKRGVEAETFDNVEIFQRDRWRCGLCHKKVDRKLAYPDPMSASLDHIVPLAEGGPHTRQNVQCAHWICNTRKQAGAGGQMRLFG